MEQYVNNPAMKKYKKRQRTKNWSNEEKKLLLQLCGGNKRLLGRCRVLKNDAWEIVHQNFCSKFGEDRSCSRLKQQWWRMNAGTRKEILEYNNRLALYGAEVADLKKPSAFTFEVWEIMQEAEKALDGIEHSTTPLALEENHESRGEERNLDEEHEMDDEEKPRSPSADELWQMLCQQHMMHMQILEAQLQSAEYNRDLMKMNKTLAMQKLQETMLVNKR